ncbi:phosphotransferase family protein [Neobacillus sp. Marseille-QA0830]
MVLPKNIVNADGTLNDRLVMKREILYKGMNGKYVERFYLTEAESYIFKPLTNEQQFGRESWVNEHILAGFPAIFPKILDQSEGNRPELSWMILEDVGSLSHVADEAAMLAVTKLMAWWHSLPVETFVDLPVNGLKPRIEDIISEVRTGKEEWLDTLPKYGMKKAWIQSIFSLIDSFIFSKKQVLSHGDLHAGNFAFATDGRMIVLDWEHAHLNTPHWDLYHVLDLSHPLFPKQMTDGLRRRVLNLYLDEVKVEVNREAFIREYYLFSSLFSMWMLGLIKKDLQADAGIWPRERLENQLQETVRVLSQCTEALYCYEKN